MWKISITHLKFKCAAMNKSELKNSFSKQNIWHLVNFTEKKRLQGKYNLT